MTNDFYQQVYDLVRLVPKGRVTSYGAIAAALGSKKASRMVGYALNLCHGMLPAVPAHRVVNRKGLLSGKMHFETPTQMEELLAEEGIKVEDNQVVDFKEKFWDPLVELM